MARRRRPPRRPGALADLSPLRILTQIVLLQLSYYLVAIVLVVFTTLVAGGNPEPSQILDWHRLRSDVTTGWTLSLCWMLDSLITVIPILLLIARSKLVLDFALTIHFVHLIVTSFYSHSIPNTIYWWLINGSSATLMTTLGVWACQWRELKPMAFGGKAKTQPKSTKDAGPSEEREGLMTGDGRNRTDGGSESYEMADMGRAAPS